MPYILNNLTKLLAIRVPVIAAPMAGPSGGALAAEVTLGGGFGFMSAGYDSPPALQRELALARSILGLGSDSPLPIGVGFLAWQLDQAPDLGKELISLAIDNNVKALWFAFGSDLGSWVRFARDHNPNKRLIIFVQISSFEEAIHAINAWGVDIIVAQGIEAGGHGSNLSPPLLALVSSILPVIPSDGPLLLAAGGLSHGRHLAAYLTLGTQGIVLGTRFLLSPESLYSQAQKDALLNASSASTVRTMAFDHVRDTIGWPQNVDGRALRNSIVDGFNNGEKIEELRIQFAEGTKKGDSNRMLVWAGTNVGLMDKILPASDIVQEIERDCLERLESVRKTLF